MKNKPVISKTETLEDIVFEGRNKLYGAYELNSNYRKYLIIAFFATLVCVTSAVAVPFIKAFKGEKNDIFLKTSVTATLEKVRDEYIAPPPPPPAPPVSTVKHTVYAPPVITEEAPPDVEIMSVGEIAERTINAPVPDVITVIDTPVDEIDEPESEPILFPEEPATFRNGGLDEFRIWVQENIIYPTIAIDNNIFGKVVVEFCVNARGEIADAKVLRGVDSSLDNEALRVISSSPHWNAPKQGGRPVKQRFVIPVVFMLSR